MRMLILAAMLLSLPNCAAWQALNQTPLNAAVCDGTTETRAELPKALLKDGGQSSRLVGAMLLGQLERGCAAASPN